MNQEHIRQQTIKEFLLKKLIINRDAKIKVEENHKSGTSHLLKKNWCQIKINREKIETSNA